MEGGEAEGTNSGIGPADGGACGGGGEEAPPRFGSRSRRRRSRPRSAAAAYRAELNRAARGGDADTGNDRELPPSGSALRVLEARNEPRSSSPRSSASAISEGVAVTISKRPRCRPHEPVGDRRRIEIGNHTEARGFSRVRKPSSGRVLGPRHAGSSGYGDRVLEGADDLVDGNPAGPADGPPRGSA